MNFHGKILLVDDEAHIRIFVSLILKSLGHPIISEATNGEEAITAFQANKPDVVLLDVNMPHLDGIQTLRKLKEIDPDCVVIMLTSLANRETVERALELGAVNYIRKDTPKEEIARSLAETLDASVKVE
jgi:two-component system, chemotaxis family, chemotaxis protein CheY